MKVKLIRGFESLPRILRGGGETPHYCPGTEANHRKLQLRCPHKHAEPLARSVSQSAHGIC